jgi:hypothetical protein
MTTYTFFSHDSEGNRTGGLGAAAGTPVRCSCGGQKLAEQIQVGDTVYVADGWPLVVAEIVVSESEV